MRDNGQRRLWWHATRRYRDGRRVMLELPVRRTRTGARVCLPARCELAAGAPVIGSKTACVAVRRWDANVEQAVADAGVERLVATMYDGQRQRIMPPRAVFALALGG